MTTTRYECVVGVLARSFLTSAARGVSYADFNTTRDATTRAQKKIFSFGFLIKKVSIHPLKKKTHTTKRTTTHRRRRRRQRRRQRRQRRKHNACGRRRFAFCAWSSSSSSTFLGRRRSGRVHVFGELTRIFCRCVRETSFIHSFFQLPHKYLICALEEGGKEDGDDDAREQQHA